MSYFDMFYTSPEIKKDCLWIGKGGGVVLITESLTVTTR